MLERARDFSAIKLWSKACPHAMITHCRKTGIRNQVWPGFLVSGSRDKKSPKGKRTTKSCTYKGTLFWPVLSSSSVGIFPLFPSVASSSGWGACSHNKNHENPPSSRADTRSASSLWNGQNLMWNAFSARSNLLLGGILLILGRQWAHGGHIPAPYKLSRGPFQCFVCMCGWKCHFVPSPCAINACMPAAALPFRETHMPACTVHTCIKFLVIWTEIIRAILFWAFARVHDGVFFLHASFHANEAESLQASCFFDSIVTAKYTHMSLQTCVVEYWIRYAICVCVTLCVCVCLRVYACV